jgi:hypothetical protein
MSSKNVIKKMSSKKCHQKKMSSKKCHQKNVIKKMSSKKMSSKKMSPSATNVSQCLLLKMIGCHQFSSQNPSQTQRNHRNKISLLINKMGRTCDTCKKSYATRQAFSMHLKKCSGEKRKPGRPKKAKPEPKVEEKDDSSHEYDVSDDESEVEVIVLPPKKKKKLVIIPNWESTFEKAKKLIEDKKEEEDIAMAIKYDDCLTSTSMTVNNTVRAALKEEFNRVCNPYREQKHKINEDFRTLDNDKKEDMRSILNIDGASVEKLNEFKLGLENELFYVEYGLTLRKLYPTIRALEMMQDMLPAEEVDIGKVDLRYSASQSFTNLT